MLKMCEKVRPNIICHMDTKAILKMKEMSNASAREDFTLEYY